jgi:tetratricopeptide (TPR) repeat protein
MYMIPGRCPVCYAQWGDGEYCSACGCAAEIYYERDLPSKERIDVARVQATINAARKRLAQYTDGVAHYALGLSYVHLNLIQEGIGELSRAADLLPEKTEIRYEIAVILVKYELNSDEALDQLNTVLSRRPDFKQAHYLRGIILQQQGKFDDAIRDWQSAYRIDNNYMPAAKRLRDFVAVERQSLTINNLSEADLDQATAEYFRLLSTPVPPPPPPLGETSMYLLRLISETTAQRMEKMHAEKVLEHETALNKHKSGLERIKGDLIGLSNLCLANYKVRHQQPIQQRVLTIEERSAILEQTIRVYQKSGWRLIARTETTAQLYKPKQFSCCLAVILVFLIIGIILYLIYYLTKKDSAVYIEVNEYGKVKTVFS